MEFVDNYLLRSNQRLWPVTANDKLVGAVNIFQISHLPTENRATLSLEDVMSSIETMEYLEPATRAKDAINTLIKAGDEPMLVVRDGKVKGLVQHADVVKWMALHQLPGA